MFIKAYCVLFTTMFGALTNLMGQIPKLNSYPGAMAVLYLDFDGQTVTGSGWNTQYTSGTPIVAASSSLSSTQITDIHNRVSEDYRPFNINITTDSGVYKAAPVKNRSCIVFTTSTSWYPKSVGGVAFVSVFSSGSNMNKVGWVFPSNLANSSANIAAAASHEAGHQFGLQHQSSYDVTCTLTNEYHQGTGSGQEAWGPIMGAPYSKNNMTWHNGSIKSGCNVMQNDLSILTSSVNLRYRDDDHGNTFATATSLNISTNSTSSGIISTSSDVDVFKIKVDKPIVLNVAAIPFNVGTGNKGANLNIKLTLKDELNTILFSDASQLTLDASIKNIPLAKGIYYMEVDGDQSAYASDYGSLGSYTLSISSSNQTSTGLEVAEWQNTIRLYPNPATSYATLNVGDRYTEVKFIEIMNTEGQVIDIISSPASSEITLNTSGFRNGIYHLRIVTNSIVMYKTLLKQD